MLRSNLKQDRAPRVSKAGLGGGFYLGIGGLGNIPLLDKMYEERQDTKEVTFEGSLLGKCKSQEQRLAGCV